MTFERIIPLIAYLTITAVGVAWLLRLAGAI